MLAGDAQTLLHDSVTPSAMTVGSLKAFVSSACIAPDPQALSG
jgi:hypothetical protein